METTRAAIAMGDTEVNKDGNSAFICPAQSALLNSLMAQETSHYWQKSGFTVCITPFDTRIYKHMFVHIHLISVGLTQAHPDYLWYAQ